MQPKQRNHLKLANSGGQMIILARQGDGCCLSAHIVQLKLFIYNAQILGTCHLNLTCASMQLCEKSRWQQRS